MVELAGSVTTAGYGRRKFYTAGDGGTLVRIEDGSTPLLESLAAEFPKEFNRALRAAGFYLRRRVQENLKSGRAGGPTLEPLSDISAYRLFDEMRGRHQLYSVKSRRKLGWKRLKTSEHPFGRLWRAVGYLHQPDKMRVLVGWLSASSANLGRRIQEGFRTDITPAMRRLAWAGQVPLSRSRRYFQAKPRPFMAPVLEAERSAVASLIEARVRKYIGGAS